MCMNNLSKVVLDSAAAGIEPVISSIKSNALTTTPPSHTYLFPVRLYDKIHSSECILGVDTESMSFRLFFFRF